MLNDESGAIGLFLVLLCSTVGDWRLLLFSSKGEEGKSAGRFSPFSGRGMGALLSGYFCHSCLNSDTHCDPFLSDVGGGKQAGLSLGLQCARKCILCKRNSG